MGILELLTVVLVAMKLAGFGVSATWSWFQVFSPLIVSGVIYLTFFTIMIIASISK